MTYGSRTNDLDEVFVMRARFPTRVRNRRGRTIALPTASSRVDYLTSVCIRHSYTRTWTNVTRPRPKNERSTVEIDKSRKQNVGNRLALIVYANRASSRKHAPADGVASQPHRVSTRVIYRTRRLCSLFMMYRVRDPPSTLRARPIR